MQFLENFYSTDEYGFTVISDQQGSEFAKTIAGDFNPIHDAGSKRFCVPGDLLFGVALAKYGLHQSMSFDFMDLVKSDAQLIYPERLENPRTLVTYAGGKSVLGIQVDGASKQGDDAIASLLRQYVAFSGQNFPHILLPLMEKHQVMINPTRPLVIYQNMSFELDTLDFKHLDISLRNTELHVEGKRGDAILNFAFNDDGREVGRGAKKLVLSGLRPYESAVMQRLCDDYLASADG